MSEVTHTIKVVARRTGLSPHVIRVWERRYGAVRPERTGTNRRLYTEAEVNRLTMLGQATAAGHSISSIAGLPDDELEKLVSPARTAVVLPIGGTPELSPETLVERCMAASRALDSEELLRVLQSGNLQLGTQGLLQRVIAPFSQELGILWRNGEISAAHEHFATGVIRTFLSKWVTQFAAQRSAPGLVVSTLSGQLHELGALLVYAAATNIGWRVTYLGASLPAAEIAGAALQNGARAIALSLVYPEDDPGIRGELHRLRELVGADLPILVGGRAAHAYRSAVHDIGAVLMTDLNDLCSTLDGLRTQLPRQAV